MAPRHLFVLGAAAMLASSVEGSVVYLEQARFVEAVAFDNEFGTTTEMRLEAEDLCPFSETATASSPNVTGSATHASVLRNDGFSASGHTVGACGPPAGTSSSDGTTSFSVTFQITVPVTATLTGSIHTIDIDGGYSFMGPSIAMENDCCFVEVQETFDITQTFLPGNYTFFMQAGSEICGEIQGSFALNFDIEKDTPCPGDINGNGTVDFGDLLDVLAGWTDCGANAAADIDHDGGVGLSDLLIVLSAWGGC